MIAVLLSLAAILPGECRSALVMLPGIPAEPWGNLSSLQLEEMWTYGIEGYHCVRSGWSGYMLRGPEGTEDVLSGLCETLSADSLIPDSSLWARTLQLVWGPQDEPGFAILTGEENLFEGMPVRRSRWFEAGADTLMLSLPVQNTVMLWGGGFSGEFQNSAWRGIGTEIIPASGFAVPALVSWTIHGSPDDMIDLEYMPTEIDQWWGSTWAPLLAAADSIVLSSSGSSALPVASVIWIRGTGGEPLAPWTFVPSPPPPVRASHLVTPLAGIVVETPEDLGLPGVVRVDMPGNAGSHSRAAYAAALLERIIARMSLPSGASCRGLWNLDGQVSVQISGVDWSAQEAWEIIRNSLIPVVFTSPESELLNNAAIRAGVPVMDQREAIELIASVTGFL